MAEVHGSCDDRFEGVRAALAQHLDADELGASVAVDLGGETVVDLWGGFRDEERTTPWTGDTIVNVWSTTKCVLSLAALMLVEQGELDLDAPVGDYWPEFSAKGKKGVLVRHLMSHTSGVPAWEQPFSVARHVRLGDRDRTAGRSSGRGGSRGRRRVPRGRPGLPRRRSGPADHRGHVPAVRGRGDRPVRWARTSRWAPARTTGPDRAARRAAAARNRPRRSTRLDRGAHLHRDRRCRSRRRLAGVAGRRPRRAQRPLQRPRRAAGDAQADPRRGDLLSPTTVDRVFDVQADGVDLVLEAPFRFGIGYALTPTPSVPYLPSGRASFWGGWGGSMVVMDLDRRLTITYMMNRMAPGAPRLRAQRGLHPGGVRGARLTSGAGAAATMMR